MCEAAVLNASSQDARLTLVINKKGLTLHKLIISNGSESGHARDLLSGPEGILAAEQEGRKFMNPVVGRYANRLPAGHQVQISDIDRPHHKLPTLDLEDSGKGVCLHSGKDGYDLRTFEQVPVDSKIVNEFREITDLPTTSTQEPESESQETTYYHLHSPSGDQGFPESIDILATIKLEILSPTSTDQQNGEKKLNPLGRVRFDLKAKISNSTSDINAQRDHQGIVAGTPINLTWHNGYILNDFKALKPDQPGIYQHKLWINTKNYLEVDESQLPTGEIKSIDSLGVDFGALPSPEQKEDEIKTIKETMPSSGFDHCFLFKRPETSEENQKINDETTCKVILISPKNDLKLKFYTNQDSVQCYSANYFDGLGTRKVLHQNSSLVTQSGYNKHESIYLEFQQPSSLCTNPQLQRNFIKFLNGNTRHEGQNINQSEFSKYTTILNPNQVYHSWFFIDFYI